GKEEELVLKERARRLVALEGQEDSAAIQQQKSPPNDVDHAATCDPRQDGPCDDSDGKGTHTERTGSGSRIFEDSTPEVNPVPPLLQDQSPLRSFTLRAEATNRGLGNKGSSLRGSEFDLMPSALRLGSESTPSLSML